MTDRPPAATRRQLLALAGGAAALPILAAPRAARAQALGRCVVATWGGDYGNLLASNIEQPILAPKGMEVVQDTGTEPARVAKLIAQRRLPRGTVDVVCAQAPAVYDLAQAGLLEVLDEGKVPNIRHVLPNLRSDTAVPHIFSPQVIIYHAERVKTAPTTFTDIEDERYKGRNAILDGSFVWAVMAAALKHSGDPMNIEAAKPVIEKIMRGGGRTYTTTDALAPALQSGEVDIAPVWHARVLFWQKAGLNVRGAFPSEGCMTYVSSMAVPKNAPNKAAAYAYLNAALEPAAQRGFADSMSYQPTVSNASLEGEVARRLALPEPAPKLLTPDYEKLNAQRNELNDWWRRLLDGR